MHQYEVYWLRELQGGRVGGEYGAPRLLGELPINETLAARIRSLALHDDGRTVSLHLPFLSHRDRQAWPSGQLNLPVQAVEPHRIVVGDLATHQFSALLAAPALGGGLPPLQFTDERTWQPVDWETVLMPMLRAHNLVINPIEPRPVGPVHVRWNLTLPGPSAAAWSRMPHRREASFLELFRGLSSSVQRALRLWLPYRYFSRPSRLAKPKFAHSYLVYSLLPPHPSRRKTQLTFHVLEPQRVIRSMTRMAKPMAEQLRRAQARIKAAQLPTEVAGYYLAGNAGDIVRSMHRIPRVFGALLSLEAFVVEEFVRFAAEAYESRHADPRARSLIHPGLGLLHNLRCRLMRSYGGEAYADVANLLLVAASAGLHWREAPEGAMKAKVTITEVATGREIPLESQFSYAISASSPH